MARLRTNETTAEQRKRIDAQSLAARKKELFRNARALGYVTVPCYHPIGAGFTA